MDNQAAAKTNLLYRGSLLISFLVGISLRVFHLFRIGFEVPFDMGGLFYQMSLEIIKNGFLPPASISYYYPGGLPFVYPPLPFYVQAIFIKLLSPDNFFVSNILPPLFSIISQVAFFFLARQVVKQKIGVAAAVFTFAIIPIAFIEQIQAMGLAESIGTLALTLYLLALAKAIENERTGDWFAAGVFLALCIVASPGSIYASILISMLLFVYSIFNSAFHKNIAWLVGCFIVGMIGLVASSPYWMNVLSRHGIDIFIIPFAAQNSRLFGGVITRISNFELIHASLFWNLLFLFGLFTIIIKKIYPLFLFSIFMLLIPREHWIMSIPASLIIGYGILYLLELIGARVNSEKKHLQIAVTWSLILFFTFDSFHSLSRLMAEDIYDISAGQISELEKIRKLHLMQEEQYVVVVGNWGLIEWSPAILEQEVINNPFGLEWLPERNQAMLRLSEDLLKMMNPAEIMGAVEKSYGSIGQVYIIASRDYLRAVNDFKLRGGVVYKTLKEFNELGLGLISARQ